MSRVEVAELVLEYIEVLAWPAVALVAFLCLRPQLQKLIEKMDKASWGQAEVRFAQDAQEVEEQTASFKEATASAGPEPEESHEQDGYGGSDLADATPDTHTDDDSHHGEATPSPKQSTEENFQLARAVVELTSGPDFAPARAVTGESPDAAVLLAFRELEKVARAALTAQQFGKPPSMGGERLIRAALPGEGSTQLDGTHLLKSLVRLRNEVVHGISSADRHGLDLYIDACENLSEAIVHIAVSKLRHPSRRGAVWEAVRKAGIDPESLGLPPQLRT